jgi:hypothetical protein
MRYARRHIDTAVVIAFALLPACITKLAVGVKSAEELKQSLEWVGMAGDVPGELWRQAIGEGLIGEELAEAMELGG